jgi:hypothetical protein
MITFGMKRYGIVHTLLEAVYQRKTLNTVGERKRTKVQTMTYKILNIQPYTYKDISIRTPHKTRG